jgi:hypothetical protein
MTTILDSAPLSISCDETTVNMANGFLLKTDRFRLTNSIASGTQHPPCSGLPATTAEKPFTVANPLMGLTVTSAPRPVNTRATRSAIPAARPDVPAWVTRIFIAPEQGLDSQK